MGTGSRSLRLLIRLALILSPVASTSSSPTGSSLSVVSNIDIQKALQVKNLLTRRLYHVESGKRRRDFAKWVQQQGGPKVFSMHGINADADEEWKRLVIRKTSKDDDAQSQILEKTARRAASQTFSNQHNADTDPFPQDRMRLDIVLDEASGQTQEGRPKNMAVADVTTPKSPGILQLSLRAIVLSLHFGPVLSTLGVALLSPNFRNNYWYAWLTHCMAACGPAWIKWGQWSSTRNDMFPDALCDALARLHSDAPAHSWQVSRETLETSLCIAPNTLDTVFDDIETTPIASGSIAQVHRAILNGELVALKIRHPRVQQLMELDFRLMGVAARIFDWLSVKITGAESQIQESVKQFSHTMAAQSYLQVEAHHLEVLNDNFKSWPQVRFPFPFFASDAVIIETYEPGRIVTRMIEQYQEQAGELQVIHVEEPSTASIDLKATIAPLQLTGGDMRVKVDHPDDEQLNAKAVVVATHDEAPRTVEAYDLIPLPMAEFLVTTGLGLYLKMLLVDGVMHADLHPGNILVDLGRTKQHQHVYSNTTNVSSDQSIDSEVKRQRGSFLGITLVDAGMVAQLTERESSNFIGLLASLGEGNGRDAANFALHFSQDNEMDEDEREAFCQEMDELFQERCRGYHTNIDVGAVLRGVLGLIRKHHVHIDANYATLVVNALCVESLARNVCPSYNLLDAAKPLLRTYRRLCYNADGSLKPNALQSRRVRAWMGLMYYVKRYRDNQFFRREARRRKLEQRGRPNR